MNVFLTFDNYIEQFRIFMKMVPDSGALIYCDVDREVRKVADSLTGKIKKYPYGVPQYKVASGKTILKTTEGEILLHIFGRHNLMNVEGARLVCNQLNISDCDFYNAISSFKGASNRLELIAEKYDFNAYRDFAHAPSKLKATIQAVKEQFPDRKLVACFELHTFSSLSKNFLNQYSGSMDKADLAVVFFSPHALELKKLPLLISDDIMKGFANLNLVVFPETNQLQDFLRSQTWDNANLLMMSSGNFDGMNVKEFAEDIAKGN